MQEQWSSPRHYAQRTGGFGEAGGVEEDRDSAPSGSVTPVRCRHPSSRSSIPLHLLPIFEPHTRGARMPHPPQQTCQAAETSQVAATAADVGRTGK